MQVIDYSKFIATSSSDEDTAQGWVEEEEEEEEGEGAVGQGRGLKKEGDKGKNESKARELLLGAAKTVDAFGSRKANGAPKEDVIITFTPGAPRSGFRV